MENDLKMSEKWTENANCERPYSIILYHFWPFLLIYNQFVSYIYDFQLVFFNHYCIYFVFTQYLTRNYMTHSLSATHEP